MSTCPFCEPEVIYYNGQDMENGSCYARFDTFPVSPGHVLVCPYHHCSSALDLTPQTLADLQKLVGDVVCMLNQTHKPDGYNIGINIGQAAGQTVNHVHVHIIPRYCGDVDNPAGGVRGVIPGKQNYLK